MSAPLTRESPSLGDHDELDGGHVTCCHSNDLALCGAKVDPEDVSEDAVVDCTLCLRLEQDYCDNTCPLALFGGVA